jgi:Vps16, C-terminal region
VGIQTLVSILALYFFSETQFAIVYQVLLNLHKRLPLGNFFKLIEDGGPKVASASKLLQIYARDQNREMLRDFFYSDDRRVDSGLLLLEEASMQQARDKFTLDHY